MKITNIATIAMKFVILHQKRRILPMIEIKRRITCLHCDINMTEDDTNNEYCSSCCEEGSITRDPEDYSNDLD